MSFNLVSFIKRRLTNLPFFVGKLISRIPYANRPSIGSIYSARQKELAHFDSLGMDGKKEFIFERVKSIAIYAYENIDFYRFFYDKHNFDPLILTCFDDIEKIPVLSKADLQQFSIEERTNRNVKSYIENTGGSSGNPLDLAIEPSSVGHEWGHMHMIWSALGFKQNELRVVFSGRSNLTECIQYDSARHQLNVDIYRSWEEIADELLKQFSHFKPRFLHGYPSAIFDFVLWLETSGHPLLAILEMSIDGMMLGSEFPNPTLRLKVESLLSCKSVSWYGHTERAVLAGELEGKGEYVPLQTYGFAEAVNMAGVTNLVSTSYYNKAHPLIRYNTEDIIEPSICEGMMTSFTISQGRNGEFILDESGNKIFLTALIFGRHHKLFDYCSSIQVYPVRSGEAVILFTLRRDLEGKDPKELFDTKNVKIQFSFIEVEKPYQSVSGKTPLLVKKI
ncbi:hypothetical protein [Pseudoalteromonas sp. Of11M-6]|uniref:hypothetical protein n=1 Tax=Pseudoalteromonas sp. Of11M-6 TaxID=2917754 RepID=UPI001EF4D020|nr:hypothetical protein [Pseudoalteromonas sp. Of11M-6]MCG7555758.1 hypothetical protein [Pseudoalteromonas sp. Of11M-6]